MYYRRITARPDYRALPGFPLPFYVRSVGHYRLEDRYRERTEAGDCFVELFWGVRGRGIVLVNDEALPLHAGDVVWKCSSDRHGYVSQSDGWELRWFTFDGPQADAFIRGYGYERRLAGVGGCPAEHFTEVERGLQSFTPDALRRLVGVAATILALAGRRQGGKDAAGLLCGRFLDMVQAHYADAQINVNSLADRLGVHRTTLNRLFHASMHMTPGDYLTRFRLQRAMTLLEEGRLAVNEIAASVGIPNPSHFARLIRAHTGRSPRQIRFNPGLPEG